MSPLVHRIYVTTMATIVIIFFLFLSVKGISYYSTPLEERFYHPDHDYFKPSGLFGHGLGIVGTLLILIGVSIYIARKRYKFLARFGRLKYWLEFHIFLCSLGPIMILFHTAFKFGGIVSVAFWSMVAVVLSGVIGRFIYIQIPRTIEGRALNLNEIQEMKTDISHFLQTSYQLDDASVQMVSNTAQVQLRERSGNLLADIFRRYLDDRKRLSGIRQNLREKGLQRKDIREVVRLVRNEMSLNHRIERLQTMQKLFKYWHVAHLPFALIMLVIVLLHVGITLAFGYTWIF